MDIRPLHIRRLADADVEAVLKLNAAAVWATSPLDEDGLARARERAALSLVCDVDGRLAAFTIVYGPGSAYESVNYRWHAERFDDFLYLDRIVVDPEFRRRGIATALYDHVEEAARAHGRLVCEVNSRPPNVESLALHKRRGYRELGFLAQADGHETVMLEKPL